jgi:hypothetical protein
LQNARFITIQSKILLFKQALSENAANGLPAACARQDRRNRFEFILKRAGEVNRKEHKERKDGDMWLIPLGSLKCCPSKLLTFAGFSCATAQGRQNHGRTESCREEDWGQFSMNLSFPVAASPRCAAVKQLAKSSSPA